jgi:AcrR family transcriptional regulator
VPATPTTRKGLRTREKILEASRLVFARDGYVEARMVDIAEQAGLSTGGLYRYFESKTDVFAALLADLHQELYDASGHTEHSFKSDPLTALNEANRGYIEHYFENRDVMRAFIEASAVDERFRTIWWEMRARHVQRFATALRNVHAVKQIGGIAVETVTEAMTCMVEQCCYVWFAQEGMSDRKVSVDDAVAVTSAAWYAAVFEGD